MAGDLAGQLTTWFLEGDEDLTQSLDNEPIDASSASDSSSSESESDDDASQQKPTLNGYVLGQHWVPSRKSLPRLPNPPLVLSFRPFTAPPALTNGTHATRQNPHPLKLAEDRLLVLTASHSLHEFHVVSGTITPWSRRNPTSSLPGPFLRLFDRAMGCIWDVVPGGKERVWFYGTGWLGRLDLGRDAPPLPTGRQSAGSTNENATSQATLKTEHEKGTKRKRFSDHHASADLDVHQNKSGAGRKIRKVDEKATTSEQSIELSGQRSGDAGDDVEQQEHDMEADEAREQTLSLLRRGMESELGGKGNTKRDKHDGWFWWCTFVYRPILGVVPMGGPEQTRPEVVLVERPPWDLDLPPRFDGESK